jgi:hypothetical protein
MYLKEAKYLRKQGLAPGKTNFNIIEYYLHHKSTYVDFFYVLFNHVVSRSSFIT